MTKKVVTNDGKKGGWLVGKRHYDKNGKSLGGIKAVVTDAGGKPVELEGGEVIINREASKKYWKELSRINQSAGNGVAIEPPTDAFDEDPSEDYENGGKIEFNANHIPNKWILNYAIKIKEEHPDVWALGGNIFGNQAFINLKRVAERGHWLDSEEWMYKKWRSYVARHQRDYRIEGVVAMLKWVDKVEKGWQYMKNLIEEEIKKREYRKSKKMNDGGNVGNKNIAHMQTITLTSNDFNQDLNLYNSLISKNSEMSEKAKISKDLILSRLPFTTWHLELKKGQNTFEFLGNTYEVFSQSKKMAASTYTQRNFQETRWGIKTIKISNENTHLNKYGIVTDEKSDLISETKGILIKNINFQFERLILRKQLDVTMPGDKMRNGGKMETGGWVQKPIKIKPDVYKFEDHQGVGYIVKRGVGERITPMWVVSTDEEGTWDGMNELFYTKKAAINYIESFFEKGGKMSNGGNLSKTPAPLSERIKGSKTNPKGTAKDAKTGASIKFDENTLSSIKSLIDAHNEKYPSKKITLGVAKAVVRRGMGAYSGTHRPTITGGKPNSRTAWGLARLKAFIHKAEKGKSKSGKYSQDNDLFEDLDITVSKFDNGGSIQTDRYYKHGYTIEQVNSIDKYLDKLNLIKVKGPKPEFESPSIYWVKKMSDEYPVVQFYRDMVYMDDKIMHEILRSTKPPFGSKETSGQRGYNPEQFAFGNALLEWVVRQLNLSENYLDRRLTGTYVFSSFEPGKPYAKYNALPDEITKFEAGGEIEKGIKAEYEHAKTIAKFKREGVSVRDVARSIAEDHLKEDPHYYSKLEKMEGKKFATGGLVTDAGGTANVGDKGVLETRNGPIQILITGITDKKVRFKIVSDNNRPDSNPVERFVRNYRGSSTSTSTPTTTPTTKATPTQGEWRVKTYDELKEQGLLRKDGKYFGITEFTIDKWAGRNVKEIDDSVLDILDSGNKSSFLFDAYHIKRDLFTKDPLPSTSQSNVVHELNNYRIKTEQDFINEYGADWFNKVGWNRSKMNWLLGKKITEIVLPSDYDDVLQKVKNNKRFYSDSSFDTDQTSWNIFNEMYMFDPVLLSQNVNANLGQTQQKDLRPSTDSSVWDATFKVNDVVYIRKDIADFVGIDFDSNDNVFKIRKEISEPSAKRPENKTGKLYKLEQVKNVTNKRIFQLEGKDIALVGSNQTKPLEFGNYILKKNVTKDDFEDIKIVVDTTEKSEAFQKLMFSLGIDWNLGDGTLQNINNSKLSVRNWKGDLIISSMYATDFDNSVLKEIKFDDLFELKGQSKPVLSDESLEELFKDVKEIDKEREAVEATPQKNETQINDELKALDDEYNDLLFLIDITPSTDVDNMLALKLQAKQLKDKIDLLHLDLKKKIDGELELLDNLFNASSVQPQERYKFNPYNDGFAPDGQPTSLPKNLYDWTMTQEFQNWFGNFTNAYNYRNSSYENTPCSVVVNKHYEPLVVYHGTGVEFSFFKFDKFPAMYFAENEAYSNWFAEIKGQQLGTNGYVYPFFLNIRTPLDLTIYGINPVAPDEFIDWMFLQTGLDADELKISKALLDPSQKFQAWMYLRNSPEMLNVLRDKAICDGIIYYEDNPSVDKSSDAYQTKAYIVFNSNSAKIADPNREMMTIPAMRSFYLKRGGKL